MLRAVTTATENFGEMLFGMCRSIETCLSALFFLEINRDVCKATVAEDENVEMVGVRKRDELSSFLVIQRVCHFDRQAYTERSQSLPLSGKMRVNVSQG